MDEKKHDSCRLCFSSSDEIIKIFSSEGDKSEIARIIGIHFRFQVSSNDSKDFSTFNGVFLLLTLLGE